MMKLSCYRATGQNLAPGPLLTPCYSILKYYLAPDLPFVHMLKHFNLGICTTKNQLTHSQPGAFRVSELVGPWGSCLLCPVTVKSTGVAYINK